MRPEARASQKQVDEARKDAHSLVDGIFDSWLQVQTQAREMGAGFPSSSVADGAGGAGGSVVERSLDDFGRLRSDPGQRARDALAEFAELRGLLRRVARLFHRELPLDQCKVKDCKAHSDSPKVDHTSTCDRCKRVITGVGEGDPNESGFCSGCFGLWTGMGRPDRAAFSKMPTCVECGEVADTWETPEWAHGEAVHHRSVKPACYQAGYRRVRKGA